MQRQYAIITGILILVCALGVVSCNPETETSSPADFYKGKIIELSSTGTPGLTDDLIYRTIASYLSRDTGATVTVSDRRGAGGMDGMNYLYSARPDGLTLGGVQSTKFVGNKILDEPAAKYEIERFSYIMSVSRRQTYFWVSPEGPCQSIADLKTGKDLKLGATSPSGYLSLAGLTVIKLLGLDATVVTGFGGGDSTAAVKRGELIGYASSYQRASVEADMVTAMFVLATERDSLMPDVPAITELVNLSGEDLELVRLWEIKLAPSALFLAPPGMPEDRLEFLRTLAEKWSQDEEFLKEINHAAGYQVQPEEYVTGNELAQAMLDMSVQLSEFQSLFAELIKEYRA